MKNTYKKQKGAGAFDALTSIFSGDKGNGEEKSFLQTVESAVGMKKSGQTEMGHLKEQISNLEQENVVFKKELEEKLRELQDKSSTILENDKKKLSEEIEMKIKKNEEEIAELKKKQSDLIEESKKIIAEAPSTTTTPAPPLATSGGGRKRRTRSRKVKKHKTRKSNKSNKKRKFRKTRKH
jgi:TolA-binding protein